MLIVPNRMHRLDAPHDAARCPGLQVLAPRAAREAVVRVDAAAEEVLPGVGTACLERPGCAPGERTYRVPLDGGGHAVVFADTLFHHPEVPGLGGFVLKYLTASTGPLGITRLGRWWMLRDGPAFAAFLRELADAPGLEAICVGHGTAITDDPRAALRAAADRV